MTATGEQGRAGGRMLGLMLAFGFASGLPLPLTIFTLQQWFTDFRIPLHSIGLTALIGLAYTLKFVWSALFDRQAPRVTRRFGRRRGWLLVVQPLLAGACVLLALSDPGTWVLGTVLAAIAVAFLSASQDILIDAWRIETFSERSQGRALAAYIWGYRGAMLTSGAGAIWLSTRIGWHGALLCMAALMAAGVATTLVASEPVVRVVAGTGGDILSRIRTAFLAPLRDFLGRPGAAEVLAFVILFRLGKVFADGTAAGFYRYRLGTPPEAVAVANFLPSLLGVLAGAAAGGWLVARFGTVRALLFAGLLQAASLGLYLTLMATGPGGHMLEAKVGLEAFAQGMADAAFLTYISALCSAAYTATQYALLSSLAALMFHTLGGVSGYAAEALGYPAFYTATILASLPALAIMLHLLRRFPPVRGALLAK